MKIGIVTDIGSDLPSITDKLDLLVILGNFLPLYDKTLVTWNIVNQVQYIENIFNPWLKKIKSNYKLVIGGCNDHLAQFYGSQTNYYLSADYIQDELITYNGINFYGMPWVPPHYCVNNDGVLSFRSRDISFYSMAIESIHDQTDILFTNVPPKMNYYNDDPLDDGDIYLSNKIEKLKNIKYHIYSMNTRVDSDIEKSINHKSICCNVTALKNNKFLQIEV